MENIKKEKSNNNVNLLIQIYDKLSKQHHLPTWVGRKVVPRYLTSVYMNIIRSTPAALATEFQWKVLGEMTEDGNIILIEDEYKELEPVVKDYYKILEENPVENDLNNLLTRSAK